MEDIIKKKKAKGDNVDSIHSGDLSESDMTESEASNME
jgi:hypothetical protein